MAKKVRVYELARELEVESKVVLAKLNDLGEFVKSPSSTIEAPVVRKLREAFPAPSTDEAPTDGAKASKTAAKKSAKKTTAKKAPAKEAEGSSEVKAEKSAEKPAEAGTDKAAKPAPTPPSVSAVKPGPKPKPAAKAAQPAGEKAVKESAEKASGNSAKDSKEKAAKSAPRSAEKATPKPAPAPKPGPKPGPKSGGPRPGNNPFSSAQGMARPQSRGGSRRPEGGGGGSPRPGNNPFASAQGMPRSGGGAGGAGGASGSKQGARSSGQRSSGPRPNPGMMPGRSAVPRPGAAPARGGRGGGPSGGRRGGAPGGTRPGGFGGGRPGGRPGPGRGGRGGTQGAFGRAGGRPVRGRKSKRAKRQEFEQMQAPSLGGVKVPRGNGSTKVRLRQGSTLTDFADKIDANPAALVTVLFHLGEMATATQSLDEDTFGALGSELGYVVEMVSAEDEDRELLADFDIDLEAEVVEDEENLQPRPPVVTVMGHVDHGKTRLLDAIRKTNVAGGEAGGITQHIGAYQVHVDHEDNNRALTIVDTPGHEAFTAMRARGAKSTDIAILVVAADDGVMPQTIEALNHAQAAEVPIVVAVNKVDKPSANPDKIRQQLTEYNLIAEEYGGETMFVDISALKNQGIDDLLEAVLLTADAALELEANPDREARGIAIEANLDKGRGAVATVLVQAGTLHVGEAIVAGTAHGRVRAMFDEHGNSVEEAGPARPVQVLGWTSVPAAGDTFLVAPDDRTARQIAERRETAERAATLAKRRKRISLEDFTEALQQGKVETLNLVLKGDVSGAVEALEDALLKVDVGDDVALRIIHRGVGAITQNDVNLATVDNAIILGFNVRPAERVGELADREGVDIRYYSVIYQAIEDVEAALKGMLKPEYEEVELGTAEIREVFRSSKFGNIAGSIIRSGEVRRNAKARVSRDGVVVGDNLSIESLRRFKDDVTEVREGYECGIGLGSFNNLQEGDIIETTEMREKPRD